MNIWKWLGLDTAKARTERNYDNNKHSTAQWAMFCFAVVLVAAIISG